MVYIPKASGLFCGVLLSLGLSMVAQAEVFDLRQETHLQQTGGGQLTAVKSHGEVLRVVGNDCFVKGQHLKEGLLQIDLTTLKAIKIDQGDRIEAKVNDQNAVLSFRPVVTDRRNDKE